MEECSGDWKTASVGSGENMSHLTSVLGPFSVSPPLELQPFLPPIERPVILLSGGFDPLHVGHLAMIQRADTLGRVVIALNSDEWLTRKKGKPFMLWDDRKRIIESLKWVKAVVIVDDSDGSVCEAIRRVKPVMFGNGGDRMPANTPEVELCLEMGVALVFGLGKKIRSSSELVREATCGSS